MGKLAHSHSRRDHRMAQALWETIGTFFKNETCNDHSIGICPREMETHSHPNLCNLISNTQELTLPGALYKWMVTYTGVHAYRGTALGNKEKQTTEPCTQHPGSVCREPCRVEKVTQRSHTTLLR